MEWPRVSFHLNPALEMGQRSKIGFLKCNQNKKEFNTLHTFSRTDCAMAHRDTKRMQRVNPLSMINISTHKVVTATTTTHKKSVDYLNLLIRSLCFIFWFSPKVY